MKTLIERMTVIMALVFLCKLSTSVYAGTKKATKTPQLSQTEVSPTEESFEFKGIVLGDSMENFLKKNKNILCEKCENPLADVVCSLAKDTTFAGKENNGIDVSFYNDKVYSIIVSLDEKNFDEVVQALHEKYGKSKKGTQIVSNRSGVKFENVIYSWQRKKAELRAQRYAGNLDQSIVIFELIDYSKEFKKREDKKTKKESKDL